MYLLFDIGGTNMRVGVSRDGKSMDAHKSLPTPADFEEGVRQFSALAEELTHGEQVQVTAGGVPGALDSEHSTLVNAPHLPGWVNHPVKAKLEEAVRSTVHLENDSALVGLGEMTQGAGKEYAIGAYISVSTGVGGARIVDKTIDRNAFGFEPGHHLIDLHGPVCEGCGGTGHLEALISGSAFVKRYGKKPYEVADSAAWEEAAKILAAGVYNVITFWSPEVVILGGPMVVGDPAMSIQRVREHLVEVNKVYKTLPEMKQAELQQTGGLWGGLALLQ